MQKKLITLTQSRLHGNNLHLNLHASQQSPERSACVSVRIDCFDGHFQTNLN